MRVQALHRWDLTPAEAVTVQDDLRGRVVASAAMGAVHTVAGVDVSTARNRAHAAIVVLSYPELQPVESAEADQALVFPYVPGLLAFREGPAILAALELLQTTPDLLVFDAHGLAHPRRMGLASHLGVIVDRPSIGCAKSLLYGQHAELGPSAGATAEIRDQDEVIGAAVRTREGTRPVYVSIGHKVDLATAIHYVLTCTKGYRVPEPTRWAHRAASGTMPAVPRPDQPSRRPRSASTSTMHNQRGACNVRE